jgi:hypothetical protein
MKTFALRLGLAIASVIVLAGTPWSVVAAEGDPPIVFVSRLFTGGEANHVARAAGGGALRVATFSAGEWQIRDLVNAASDPAQTGVPVDVADPDVSYDGSRIVFAGYSDAEKAWRIFEVGANGGNLRQLTTADRSIPDLEERYGAAASRFGSYDDADPCYLPDGRICFVSTRYPGVAPGGRYVATNLYVMKGDGSDLHRITSERFGADTPAVDPSTGEIAYSRWWLTAREVMPPSGGPTPNRPPVYYGPVTNPNNFSSTVLRGIADSSYDGVNNWFIATIRPDGSGLTMRTGFGLNRELTMAYRPSFLESGELIAQFITESPIVNQRSRNGLRLLGAPGSLPRALGGPQAFNGDATLQDPNPGVPARQRTEPRFFYHSSNAYGQGRILVTGAVPGGNFEYDVFVQTVDSHDPARDSTSPTRLFGAPGAAELDAVALVARLPLPPRLEDEAPRLDFEVAPRTREEAVALGGTFTFLVENIFANGPVDMRIASAPPIGRDLEIEFYMNPQRQGTTTPEAPILVGSKPIGPDGRVEMELPAGVPLFEILRRPDGTIALGRDGQAFHVGGMNFGVKGDVARCVGCHAGHSQLPVAEGEEAAWTNVAPSALVTAHPQSTSDPRGNGLDFPPAVLVDRLTDPVASEWAAVPEGEASTVQLRWIQPIAARELVVYGTKHGQGRFGARSQVIHGFKVETYLHAERLEPRSEPASKDPPPSWGLETLVSSQVVREQVSAEGTRVRLDPSAEFDILRITIDPADVTGLFEGENRPALAEVEVVGKAGGGGASPTVAFVGGDANCDSLINVSDPVTLMNSLFLGAGALCCEAAADVTFEGAVDISDAVYLLNYLFQGADPWSRLECQRITGAPHGCEQETCP